MASYDFDAPRLYVEQDLAFGVMFDLDRARQNYLCNVLRLSEGDNVLVFNGRDGEWRAALSAGPNRKQMALRIADLVRGQVAPTDLHYFFAPLKHARLDYMVQKAVEMGASTIRPVTTRRTQVSRVNLDRMRANVIEAAEQCCIIALPKVHEVEILEQAIADWPKDRYLIFCDEDAGQSDPAAALRNLPRGRPRAVLIGPEGGFDAQERAALLSLPSVVRLSLGPRILRADTAAVAALALVQALAGDWQA